MAAKMRRAFVNASIERFTNDFMESGYDKIFKDFSIKIALKAYHRRIIRQILKAEAEKYFKAHDRAEKCGAQDFNFEAAYLGFDKSINKNIELMNNVVRIIGYIEVTVSGLADNFGKIKIKRWQQKFFSHVLKRLVYHAIIDIENTGEITKNHELTQLHYSILGVVEKNASSYTGRWMLDMLNNIKVRKITNYLR